jgi:hypothetical protein
VIRKSGVGEGFLSPTGQKVLELQKKLRNVSKNKKLSTTDGMGTGLGSNTFQARMDKYSLSPERNVNRSLEKNENYHNKVGKFIKNIEEFKDNRNY